MIEFKRKHYLDLLIQRKHNHMIKIITGLRRSGKSYLLNTLFKNHLLSDGVDEQHIISLALDDFDNHGVYSKDYTDFMRKEYGVEVE